MITKTSVASASATLISAAKTRNWFAISHDGSGTVHVALDGSSDVSSAAGAKPGIPIAAGSTLTMHGVGRAPGSFDEAFYAVHSLGGSVNIVVQEG